MTGNSDIIKLSIRLLCGGAASAVFALMFSMARSVRPRQLILRTYEQIGVFMERRGRGFWDYRKQYAFLKRNGAEFHFGRWVEPVRYTVLRIAAAGLGLTVGWSFGWIYGLLMAAGLFCLPDALLVYLNGRDNERLLPELKLVYGALAVQIRAGVYVTDALAECYGSVREERLRAALLELSGDIVMKADMDQALDRFQEKFDNRYVDSLCITITQAMESGQAVDLLADISEQIKDMEVTVLSRRKGALDRKITFYQLGVLAAVLTVVLYACVTHMLSAAVNF